MTLSELPVKQSVETSLLVSFFPFFRPFPLANLWIMYLQTPKRPQMRTKPDYHSILVRGDMF
jgi:hypothetical protein